MLHYRTTDSVSFSEAETRDFPDMFLALRKLQKKMELPFSDSLKNNMKGILNAQNDNR